MSTDADLRTLANHMRSRLVLRACITNEEWKTVAGKLDAIADSIATHVADHELTFTPPDHGFDCFHCGSHFSPLPAGIAAAREHFGPTPADTPRCMVEAIFSRSPNDDEIKTMCDAYFLTSLREPTAEAMRAAVAALHYARRKAYGP